MIFTKIAAVFTWIMLIAGLSKLTIGLFVATSQDWEQNILLSKRYFNAASTGEVINESIMMIATSLLIGVIVEISKGVNKRF